MEIIPGEGLPVARVGQTRAEIEALVGPATFLKVGCVSWPEHSPPFTVYFAADGRAQLIEVYHGVNGQDQATFGGVQLTRRVMDDVLSDLAREGVSGRRTDIVADFDEGFTLWSLLSLSPADVDPARATDPAANDHPVVEGVAIAPAHYWATC